MVLTEEEYYVEKSQYQQQIEQAKAKQQKLAQQTQALIVDNALRAAFIETGGKMTSAEDGAEKPYDLV